MKIRVNARGDTCVDNHGPNAPYVTVSSQMDGGLYRIQPNQHVTFERGSLRDVVDTETEPCGCPTTPVDLAENKKLDGSAPAPAENEFPLAVSEGLAPAPAPPTEPVAKTGEVHAQVTMPLTYNGETAAAAALPAAEPAKQQLTDTQPIVPARVATSQTGFFHRVGHFFSRVFSGN